MRKVLTSFFSAILFFSVCSSLSWAEEAHLRIIHLNDLQSRFENGAKLKGYIDFLKETADGDTLVVDAGDFHMGSLMQHVMQSEGGEWALLSELGVEYTTLGNHEFDFGIQALVQAREASKKWSSSKVVTVQSNLSSRSEKTQAELDKLVDHRSVIIEKAGVKIGLLGVLGQHAASVTPPLWAMDVCPPAECLADQVKDLRSQGAQMVILLSHSGIFPSQKLGKGGYEGEDWETAQTLDGIDLIVSGHTHVLLSKPVVTEKGTRIVQAGSDGRAVGYIDIVIKDGTIDWRDGMAELVDDNLQVDVDRQFAEKHQGIWKTVETYIEERTGKKSDHVLFESRELFRINDVGTELGYKVVAAVHNQLEFEGLGKISEVILPHGFLRSHLNAGPVTIGSLYQTFPLGGSQEMGTAGYPLLDVYLDRSGFRDLMEMSATVGLLMHPSYFLYFSRYAIGVQEGRPPFDKVSTPMPEPGPFGLYRIVIDQYVYDMLAKISETSFGLLEIIPRDKMGKVLTAPKYIQSSTGSAMSFFEVLSRYLERQKGWGEVSHVFTKLEKRSLTHGSYFENWTWRMYVFIGIIVAVSAIGLFLLSKVVSKYF